MPEIRVLALAAVAALSACVAPEPKPVPIDVGAPCAFCHMAIADLHLAAEIVAPGEEPRQYDDIGCLASDIRKRGLPAGGRAFVADYRTGALVPAGDAAYTRLETIATPMLSHLVAHVDRAARAADPRVTAGARLTAADVFGDALTRGGTDGR